VSLDRIEGLRRALQAAPDNDALRLLLAETLVASGRPEEGLQEYELLLHRSALSGEELLAATRVALDAVSLALAGRLLEAARNAGVVEGVAELQGELDRALEAGGVVRLVRQGPFDREGKPLAQIDERERITFSDVGGLDAVKKTIHRTIVLPYQRPDLYLRYGRGAGGGVLLYGPPGCGKTKVARATAGECGLPFSNVRIEEILDPYFGVSERNLHESFQVARAAAPCVIFLDELDAIAFARRKFVGSAGRPLVDQLLQELDAIGSDNRDLLVLAATNAPWDVDEALKRPGRFDRMVFVPPPDEPARARILELVLAGRPVEGVDVAGLAKRARLFSGADLQALVERAVDGVIEEALDTGGEPPLAGRLTTACRGARPPALRPPRPRAHSAARSRRSPSRPPRPGRP
jgi:transitional endoplasmic reticulum ATPase